MYARSVLEALPPGATLLADYTPYETLSYVQLVEKLGTGVHLVQCNPEKTWRAHPAFPAGNSGVPRRRRPPIL